MVSRFVVTLSAALAVLLVLPIAPAGAVRALGLSDYFSSSELEVSILEQSKDGAVIVVHGTRYQGDEPGIEIALNPVGYRGSGTRSTFITSTVHDPEDPSDWTYRLVLDAAQVAALDPDTSYQVMTMRAGGRDAFDWSDSATARVPFDWDELARSDSSPSPQEPSTGTGPSGGTGSGPEESGGTDRPRPSGTDDTTAAGSDGGDSGAGEKKKAPRKPWSAPDEPPTVTGLELTGIGKASVDADGVLHARASGFTPNEAHIKVVVYSSPVVLSTDITANGRGVATWSGRLPKEIGLGRHTLTFQGSVDRGISFIVTGTPNDGECAQDDCAPAATSSVEPSTPVSEDDGIGALTWIIVATMILLGLVASAVAMLSGHRERDQDWDAPVGSPGPPRYPPNPRRPAEHAPVRPQHQQPRRPMRQDPPRDEVPLPRRLPPGEQQRTPDPREPAPRPAGHRRGGPQHLEPAPAAPPQPTHRQRRPPESFAPPSQRGAYEGQRVAGR